MAKEPEVPTGIEQVLMKAAVEEDFRERLLRYRVGAARSASNPVAAMTFRVKARATGLTSNITEVKPGAPRNISEWKKPCPTPISAPVRAS